MTIYTKDKVQWFGEVREDRMGLNEIGEIAQKEWLKTAEIRPYVYLDEFVVMPNHFHGIITIDKGVIVETQSSASLPTSTFGPQSHNLASIIRGFKAATTTQIRRTAPTFAWQPRFYEVILDTQKRFDNATHYIHNNPLSCALDRKNIF